MKSSTRDLVESLDVSGAPLPAVYAAAKSALAECVKLDECKSWADKAAALASYARQQRDKSLVNLAMRVQVRATRRIGELLAEFDGRGRPAENKDGTVPNLSQEDAADRAGLSERQRKTAGRVAKVPTAQFEALVEGDEPPTVGELAELGKASREPPPGYARATYALGRLRDFAKFCGEHDAAFVAGGVRSWEVADARAHMAAIEAWFDAFDPALGEGEP